MPWAMRAPSLYDTEGCRSQTRFCSDGTKRGRVPAPPSLGLLAPPVVAMMHGDRMGGGWGVWAILWTVLLVALIVLAIAATVWLIRGSVRGRQGSAERTAREELDLRYARGELSSEEYTRRRRDIEA